MLLLKSRPWKHWRSILLNQGGHPVKWSCATGRRPLLELAPHTIVHGDGRGEEKAMECDCGGLLRLSLLRNAGGGGQGQPCPASWRLCPCWNITRTQIRWWILLPK